MSQGLGRVNKGVTLQTELKEGVEQTELKRGGGWEVVENTPGRKRWVVVWHSDQGKKKKQ